MTTLVALTIMLVPAAATRTAGASSPTERNWQASYGYMKQIARKQHLRADDLQRRLTVRVHEVRQLNAHIARLRRKVQIPSAVSLAHAEAVRLGLSAAEWNCAAALISRENANPLGEWDPLRYNGQGSGAYGLPQALPGHKMASAGDDWAWNPATQFRWFVSYAKGRYGGVCQANSYQLAHRSY